MAEDALLGGLLETGHQRVLDFSSVLDSLGHVHDEDVWADD
jgi:hypothetical protein